ncbi:membrane-associated phospholipid phosphatase [Lewinella aquimaris]|uniref:Membrane-associated phospholipid phosphatase n=1 Tax=Neolewinella aquimaris TaxID=1835722 RepID=A0A840E0M7_9BACT|nr:phosphatase PAP2 family protein [Neolewinella aquimaris]MBB4078690.1 membrane-associated phospholipid phosphatase [Neolewinella aquimaris]
MRYPIVSWIFTLLLLLGTVPLAGQQDGKTEGGPYYISLKRDLLYGSASVGSVALGSLLRSRTPDIVLSDLRLGNIPSFDRIATEFSSASARTLSDYSLYASAALPGLLMAGRRSRREAGKISLLFLETMLLNQGLTDIIKSSAKRPRPYVFDDDLDPATIIGGNDRAAFLSGHTSSSAAAGFFFARAFSDYYPASRLKPYAWVLGAGVPALTGYLRIRAGQHYPSDVLAGYALGAVIGYVVPALHRRPPGGRRLTVAPSGGGMYVSYRF